MKKRSALVVEFVGKNSLLSEWTKREGEAKVAGGGEELLDSINVTAAEEIADAVFVKGEVKAGHCEGELRSIIGTGLEAVMGGEERLKSTVLDPFLGTEYGLR